MLHHLEDLKYRMCEDANELFYHRSIDDEQVNLTVGDKKII
jgi:hypothetical protein